MVCMSVYGICMRVCVLDMCMVWYGMCGMRGVYVYVWSVWCVSVGHGVCVGGVVCVCGVVGTMCVCRMYVFLWAVYMYECHLEIQG